MKGWAGHSFWNIMRAIRTKLIFVGKGQYVMFLHVKLLFHPPSLPDNQCTVLTDVVCKFSILLHAPGRRPNKTERSYTDFLSSKLALVFQSFRVEVSWDFGIIF